MNEIFCAEPHELLLVQPFKEQNELFDTNDFGGGENTTKSSFNINGYSSIKCRFYSEKRKENLKILENGIAAVFVD